MYALTAIGAETLKNFEGLRLEAYSCPAGYLTIGYGHRLFPTSTGIVQIVTNQQEAERWFQEDTGRVLSELFTEIKTLIPNQVDALTSFIYNIGINAWRGSSARRELLTANYKYVPGQIMRWVHDSHGNVIPGLVARREREAAMFLGGSMLTLFNQIKAVAPKLSLGQIIAIAKLICASADAVCPIVNGMVAKPHRIFQPLTATGLTPAQVAKAYNFPVVSPPLVAKRTIAILEFGGQYPVTQGVKVVEIDGAAESSDGADGEVSLDIQVIQGAAPGVKILLIFAPNSEQGFADAVAAARLANVDAISISWGGPEDQWSTAGRQALDTQFKLCTELGIGVYCASGDSGSRDGETFGNHVDYPASSPYVVACGGTHLELNPDGTRSTETAWGYPLFGGGGASGGGVSTAYAGRKVPDIAGNADPSTGYIIQVDGQSQQVGGTSAVAPLYAALQVLLNASLGRHVGHLPAQFYLADKTEAVFFDVTSGNNGGYKAGPGYDEVTGLGAIDGQRFLNWLGD